MTTEKDIRQYLHLYLGCEVQTPTRRYPIEGGKSYKAIGRLLDIDLVINQGGVHFPENAITDLENYPLSELKPVLARLKDITDLQIEELIQFEKLKRTYSSVSYSREISRNGILIGIDIDYTIVDEEDGGVYPNGWGLRFASMNAYDCAWLLSKGFDLFGLIDAGLAIDKKTL